MEIIAYIHTDMTEKFGVPRQSGIVDKLTGIIEFTPKYNCIEAVKGLEEFTHIWLLWEFSKNVGKEWKFMVRPPRLGGNTYKGVFATRSPVRPNPIGLSSVKLEKVILDEKKGPKLIVSGVDMIDNTPIYDIKPYIPYSDCHVDAIGGFADRVKDYALKVEFANDTKELIPQDKLEALVGILSLDPRPGYKKMTISDRIYGISYAGYNIRFIVEYDVLTVVEISKIL